MFCQLHKGEYYKLTYADGSKVKVVDPVAYRPTFSSGSPIYDANTKYLNPQGQKVVFNSLHQHVGARMTSSNDFSISWVAPIVPSVSLAGIPLDVSAEVLERVLLKIIDASSLLYKFENSPDLLLRTHGLDELGNGGYSFRYLMMQLLMVC